MHKARASTSRSSFYQSSPRTSLSRRRSEKAAASRHRGCVAGEGRPLVSRARSRARASSVEAHTRK
eukprot:1557281-Pleurochrysis_carterae.AAC.4